MALPGFSCGRTPSCCALLSYDNPLGRGAPAACPVLVLFGTAAQPQAAICLPARPAYERSRGVPLRQWHFLLWVGSISAGENGCKNFVPNLFSFLLSHAFRIQSFRQGGAIGLHLGLLSCLMPPFSQWLVLCHS